MSNRAACCLGVRSPRVVTRLPKQNALGDEPGVAQGAGYFDISHPPGTVYRGVSSRVLEQALYTLTVRHPARGFRSLDFYIQTLPDSLWKPSLIALPPLPDVFRSPTVFDGELRACSPRMRCPRPFARDTPDCEEEPPHYRGHFTHVEQQIFQFSYAQQYVEAELVLPKAPSDPWTESRKTARHRAHCTLATFERIRLFELRNRILSVRDFLSDRLIFDV